MLRLKFMPALLVVVMSLTAGAAPAGNEVEPSCEGALASSLNLPSKWGLSPGDLDAIVRAAPGLAQVLPIFVRLAHLVDDPRAADFFDLVGAYAGVGFAREALAGGEAMDAFELRVAQLESLNLRAVDRGLLPRDLGPGEITVLADLLGPLDAQDPIDTPSLRTRDFDEPLKAFIDAHRVQFPLARDFILQSEAMLRAMINVMVGYSPDEMAFEALVEKLRARLRGEPVFETGGESRTLNLIEVVADRDVKRLLKSPGYDSRDKKQTLQRIVGLESSMFKMGFTFLFLRSHLSLEHFEASDRAGVLRNPLALAWKFEDTLVEDAFADQGLAPLFRRAYAEVILGKSTVTGRRLQMALRTRLETVFRELRLLWREVAKSTSSASRLPDLPDRTQRLREYADGLSRKPKVSHAAATPVTATSITVVEPAVDPAAAVWDDLLDPSRALPLARAHVESTVTPDVPIALDLKRTEYRYRVEFSRGLLLQLIEPAAGAPQDPREWFEALRWGGARDVKQRGWKKLKTRVLGIYDWEVKLLNSPYRMLGYKKRDGVWRFERIELTH